MIDVDAIAAEAKLKRDAADVATALEYDRLRQVDPFAAARVDMFAMTRGRQLIAQNNSKKGGGPPEAA